jgi:hypothetical protein
MRCCIMRSICTQIIWKGTTSLGARFAVLSQRLTDIGDLQ